MKKLLIPIIILLLITQVSAQVILDNDIQNLKTEYNNNLDKIPGIVKRLAGNERINTYLTLNTNEQIIIGAVTKKAKIIEIKLGGIEKPTLNIYITENTIKRLEHKEITIEQAIETKEIRIESQRIRTSIKLWFINLIRKIASWF